MDRRAPRYLIASDDARAQGWYTTRERAEALVAEQTPTTIMPDDWQAYPVCRITLK